MVAWNINGLTSSKLFLHDTCDYLQGFDIVLLTETRCMTLPENFLTNYSIDFAPSLSNGRAGQGVLVAVKKCISLKSP